MRQIIPKFTAGPAGDPPDPPPPRRAEGRAAAGRRKAAGGQGAGGRWLKFFNAFGRVQTRPGIYGARHSAAPFDATAAAGMSTAKVANLADGAT